jgi:hypothetical protein
MKVETIEEFIARGGKIQVVKPYNPNGYSQRKLEQILYMIKRKAYRSGDNFKRYNYNQNIKEP